MTKRGGQVKVGSFEQNEIISMIQTYNSSKSRRSWGIKQLRQYRLKIFEYYFANQTKIELAAPIDMHLI